MDSKNLKCKKILFTKIQKYFLHLQKIYDFFIYRCAYYSINRMIKYNPGIGFINGIYEKLLFKK